MSPIDIEDGADGGLECRWCGSDIPDPNPKTGPYDVCDNCCKGVDPLPQGAPGWEDR